MLQLSKITLTLEFTTPAVLPYWMGSAFRGGFGQNLRKAICPDSQKICSTCTTKDTCLFFYTHMNTLSQRGHAPPSKPIILIPPFFGKEMRMNEKGWLNVDVLFFGDFTKYLPHVILGMSLFGRRGLYAQRYYGMNKFVIKEIVCTFTGKTVYDGETIYLRNLMVVDVRNIEPFKNKKAKIGFRTPFTGSVFPPLPADFIALIRNRLIRFVNEYGTKEIIPETNATGTIEACAQHSHTLERRSMRSTKKTFMSHTGVVDYTFDLTIEEAWILNVGFIIGCGPDSSFGCGFLKTLD